MAQIYREDFEKMDPVSRMEFMRSGGTLKDNIPPRALPPAEPWARTRAEYKDQLRQAGWSEREIHYYYDGVGKLRAPERAGPPTMKRADFDALTPREKNEFILKARGRVED